MGREEVKIIPKDFRQAAAMSLGLRLQLLLLLLATIIISRALSAVNISHLPGFDGPLPFHLETGYESIGDAELFYYFVQSERNPGEDPLLLWLTGGPGCTGLSTLAYEIGPLKYVSAYYEGVLPSLMYNPYSWTKVANIIFIDAPVGTGFSFSTIATAYEFDDQTISLQICNFLAKWYYNHPYFLSNPLYIAGDSWGGKIVPIVTRAIVEGQLTPAFSNLKGYIAGSPRVNATFDSMFRLPFSHAMGIISDENYKAIVENCEGEIIDQVDPHRNLPCYTALMDFTQLLSELYLDNILSPRCPPLPNQKVMIANRRQLQEAEHSDFPVRPQVPDTKCKAESCKQDMYYNVSYYWANNKLAREALHIKKGTVREWLTCNGTVTHVTYNENILSTLEYHHFLIQSGYRVLVYSGDHDLTIPFTGTHAWIKSLNFSIVDDWRSWHVDGQVAGYTRMFANDLTFATIKNAGHVAQLSQPERCFAMFCRWISHERL